MRKVALVWFVAAAFLLTGLQAWAKEGGEKGPSSKAWERANENASFKRTSDVKDVDARKAMREERVAREKAEKEARRSERDIKKAKEKAEKEARRAQKESEKETKKRQREMERQTRRAEKISVE